MNFSPQPQNDVTIYKYDPVAILRIMQGDAWIDPDTLRWKTDDDHQIHKPHSEYLTLQDISDQLAGHTGVIFVWVEQPLSGIIYEYGNHPGNDWREHGKTRGYA